MTSQADAVETLSAQLRTDLTGLSARLEAERDTLLASWPTLGRLARVRALAGVRRRVAALTSAAQELARSTVGGVIADAYRLGAGGMALSASAAPLFDGADTAAITALAQDTYSSVLTATSGVRQSTKQLIRTLARQHVLDTLVTGQTPAQAANALKASLVGQGVHAVTYADGSLHQLGDYSDMLIRTKTAEASQQGGFAQARTLGIEWVEIFDGPGCGLASHQDSRKANGLILTVDEAAAYPLSHPRCRRTTSGRPDLTSHQQAADAKPLGPQYSAEDIAREHASHGTGTSRPLSAAAARNAARSSRLDGTSAAQRRAATRTARRSSR